MYNNVRKCKIYFLLESKCYTHIQRSKDPKFESDLRPKFGPTQTYSISDKECKRLLSPKILKEQFRDVVCSYPFPLDPQDIPKEIIPTVNFIFVYMMQSHWVRDCTWEAKNM